MRIFFKGTTSLLLVSMYWAFAQVATAQGQGKSERKAWIMTTALPDDVTNPLKVLSGEDLQEVKIYSRSMGKAIEVDKTGLVRVVKEVKAEDGEITYENLSQSQIPEGVREALIVLVPRKSGAEGLRFNSKVIDLSKFKGGGCLYINLINTRLGIAIGDLKTVVMPGGMEFINPLENKDNDVKLVRYLYEIPNKEPAEWKLMTSAKMAIYKSRREICIFFYNEAIENVDFRGIPFITPVP